MTLLELTFAIIKPHILKNPVALNDIRNIILNSNFKIVRTRRHQFTPKHAETFYMEHKNKFFYNRLVTFMVSGPSDMHILAREGAIKKWRELMGPTKVFKTIYGAPHTIRGQYGLSDTRNATHGSDSPESARIEMGQFFPDFNIDSWYENEEPFFRKDLVQFCEKDFVHKVDAEKLNVAVT